jgi:hypothetical protein
MQTVTWHHVCMSSGIKPTLNYGPSSLNILSAHVRWVVTGRGTAETTSPPVTPVEMNFPIDIDLPANYITLK